MTPTEWIHLTALIQAAFSVVLLVGLVLTKRDFDEAVEAKRYHDEDNDGKH